MACALQSSAAASLRKMDREDSPEDLLRDIVRAVNTGKSSWQCVFLGLIRQGRAESSKPFQSPHSPSVPKIIHAYIKHAIFKTGRIG